MSGSARRHCPLSGGWTGARDIVILEAGEVVPADLRLLEVYALRMQEAALTGEAEAVTKSAEALLPALCVNTIGRSYPSDGPSALPQFLWHPYT